MEGRQLIVAQIPAGPIETNAYLVVEPDSSQALIIDAPPDVTAQLQAEIERLGATPIALVLTHTHWDHVGDAAEIAQVFGIPIYVHELDRSGLENPASTWMEIRPATADHLLVDGETITCGNREFLVMHTPGHSPGQASLYSEADRLLLGGDTLFPNGYGRVDIPGASKEDTVATISRLLSLPDDVTVLPGHGAPTTIGRERPWMEQVAASGQLFE